MLDRAQRARSIANCKLPIDAQTTAPARTFGGAIRRPPTPPAVNRAVQGGTKRNWQRVQGPSPFRRRWNLDLFKHRMKNDRQRAGPRCAGRVSRSTDYRKARGSRKSGAMTLAPFSNNQANGPDGRRPFGRERATLLSSASLGILEPPSPAIICSEACHTPSPLVPSRGWGECRRFDIEFLRPRPCHLAVHLVAGGLATMVNRRQRAVAADAAASRDAAQQAKRSSPRPTTRENMRWLKFWRRPWVTRRARPVFSAGCRGYAPWAANRPAPPTMPPDWRLIIDKTANLETLSTRLPMNDPPPKMCSSRRCREPRVGTSGPRGRGRTAGPGSALMPVQAPRDSPRTASAFWGQT